ncbi:MAG: capsule biosynthesis protein CapA [Pseudomonadota bacterium]
MPRRFLFLQGPHGPFFAKLAEALDRAGCETLRVGLNAGDEWSWGRARTYTAYQEPAEAWSSWLEAFLKERGVTDLVLYGDARPHHAAAITLAEQQDITLHVFEEGYLRPYWVTYERGGVNGASPLMSLTTEDILHALPPEDAPLPNTPDQWGTALRHALSGALYHGHIALKARKYPQYRSHRGVGVAQETGLYVRKILKSPFDAIERRWATQKVLTSGVPFHLVLLQLGHDSSVQAHSGYDCMAPFIAEVTEAFAQGAPSHHVLVFKTHPFDDGREPMGKLVASAARAAGVRGRVSLIPGGPLATLLDTAQSAVTINSTAAQQALWRGLPVKALGRAVYSKPEFVSDQPLVAFFADPQSPDHHAYLGFRRFLLFTSQIKGSFYTGRGRADILRDAVDRMLANEGPYEALLNTGRFDNAFMMR